MTILDPGEYQDWVDQMISPLSLPRHSSTWYKGVMLVRFNTTYHLFSQPGRNLGILSHHPCCKLNQLQDPLRSAQRTC